MAFYMECLQANPLLTDRPIWHQIHSTILSHLLRRATRMADGYVLFQIAVSNCSIYILAVIILRTGFPDGKVPKL